MKALRYNPETGKLQAVHFHRLVETRTGPLLTSSHIPDGTLIQRASGAHTMPERDGPVTEPIPRLWTPPAWFGRFPFRVTNYRLRAVRKKMDN